MSRLLNMAWLSRHDPTPAQRKNLSAYHIHVIHPPNRFWAAEDAWALAQTRCRGIPDLIFCVMPIGMLREFLRLVGGGRWLSGLCMIIRATRRAGSAGSGLRRCMW